MPTLSMTHWFTERKIDHIITRGLIDNFTMQDDMTLIRLNKEIMVMLYSSPYDNNTVIQILMQEYRIVLGIVPLMNLALIYGNVNQVQ